MSEPTSRSASPLPLQLDGARMVAEGREFSGALALARLSRLRPELASTAGSVRYRLRFGTDPAGYRSLHVELHAELALQCQRTLDTYMQAVTVDVTLVLLDNERAAAALPATVDYLLLENGELQPALLIEDELLLALPLIPVKPDSEVVAYDTDAESAGAREVAEHPFAALRALKNDLKTQ